MKFRIVLLTSAFLASGVLAAAAQSSTSPNTPGTGGVSAATHCRDAQGVIKLKNARSGSRISTTRQSSTTTGTSEITAPTPTTPLEVYSKAAENLPTC
jgi:hypothetical protein